MRLQFSQILFAILAFIALPAWSANFVQGTLVLKPGSNLELKDMTGQAFYLQNGPAMATYKLIGFSSVFNNNRQIFLQ